MPELDGRVLRPAAIELAVRMFGGSARPPLADTVKGHQLLFNLTRLSDKAVREYVAARAAAADYAASRPDSIGLRPYLHVVDHCETCVNAFHRAARHVEKVATDRDLPRLDKTAKR